jgi:hypothetical protein
MNIQTYKILISPLKLSSFFKHGVPFTYLRRIKKEDKGFIYELGWYFNNNGCEKEKVGYFNKNKELVHYNYSNQRYLGHQLSLKLSYKQFFKSIFKS